MLFFTGFLHHTVIAYVRRIIQILAKAGFIILAELGTLVSVTEFAAAEAGVLRFIRTKIFVQALVEIGAVIMSAGYAIDKYPVILDLS